MKKVVLICLVLLTLLCLSAAALILIPNSAGKGVRAELLARGYLDYTPEEAMEMAYKRCTTCHDSEKIIKYCSRCGASLEMRDVHGTSRPSCPQCGKILFYDPKLAATAVVEQDGKILMVRRLTEPGLGLWSLPGGYVDRGEVVEQAAAREVLEETGLQVDITSLIGLFSEDGQPVVLAAFDGLITGGEAKAGPEVSELGFFALEALPPLAFLRDINILEKWNQLKSDNSQGER